jgi:NAD-dependent SIR2 family protein deacetylase
MNVTNQIQKAFNRVDEKIYKKYRDLLKNHDWYSEYSDDHRRWEQASVEYTEIMCIAQNMDRDYKIFNEYAPDEYKKESKHDN